jgi:Bacterial Ig domain
MAGKPFYGNYTHREYGKMEQVNATEMKRLGVTWSLGTAFCLFGPTCHLMAQPTLRITSPTEGAVVNPGQVLTVTVEASPKDAFDDVAVIGWSPIGLQQVLTAPPYRFSLRIPQSIVPARSYHLTAAGGLHEIRSEPVYSGAVSIQVERADIATSLIPGDYYINSGEYPSTSMHVYRSLRLSRVGIAEMLYVRGIFADHEQVDLTESSYLKHSSDNPRVAKVDERGTVVATGTGSARITITYRSKSVVVPVTVGQ